MNFISSLLFFICLVFSIKSRGQQVLPAKHRQLLSTVPMPSLSDSVLKSCPGCYVAEFKSNETDTLAAWHKDLWNAKQKQIIGPFPYGKENVCWIVAGEKEVSWEVRAREIYIGEVDSTEAQRVLDLVKAEMKKGRTFANCAKEYSKDGASQQGGDLGWFGEGVMVPAFEAEILKHKKGDMYLVHTPEFGWMIAYNSEDKRDLRRRNTLILVCPKVG